MTGPVSLRDLQHRDLFSTRPFARPRESGAPVSGLSVLLQKLKLRPIGFKLVVNLEGMSPFSTSGAFSLVTSGSLLRFPHTRWCFAGSGREMLKTLAVACATVSHHQRAVVIARPLAYPDDTLVVVAVLG